MTNMRTSCIILTVLITVTIMIVCVMVKYATEISMDDVKRDDVKSDDVKSDKGGVGLAFERSMGVITLSDKPSVHVHEYSRRFPYLAAIVRNSSSTWSFGCFGSVILVKWVVTAAHCWQSGSIHRVLLYYDFSKNYTHTYPILVWRLHENYSSIAPSAKYDIAIAKMNLLGYSFTMRTSGFDQSPIKHGEVAVWKTVATMNKELFLTNDLEKYAVTIAPPRKCYDAFDVVIDESLICVDLSAHADCFTHDFGPLYCGDKVVGLIALKPLECEDKYAVFTNISFYTSWILKATKMTVV